ncbi:NAD-dependent epimerase/dehydratase family protein [Streptomyces sp. NBC_00696]|uniref:NAD-dependent epimerase/dehydratase family protein n=1 Tax=Streptomyces sp. NBC_00696 TaxID=2903672 RepID=UPI002E2EED0C|nr:NAD-dependent epimerase/dehydratase family protein [Streptomyces sp. NBC_00696]
MPGRRSAGTWSRTRRRALARWEGRHLVYTTGIGDPAKRWSWVHVDDLADAYVRILDNPAAVEGETFVIADDQRLTALDMQRTAIRAAGHTGEIALESTEAGCMLQLAADQDELVTSAKAHRLLDWTPRHISFTDAPTRHYRAWKAAQPFSAR